MKRTIEGMSPRRDGAQDISFGLMHYALPYLLSVSYIVMYGKEGWNTVALKAVDSTRGREGDVVSLISSSRGNHT